MPPLRSLSEYQRCGNSTSLYGAAFNYETGPFDLSFNIFHRSTSHTCTFLMFMSTPNKYHNNKYNNKYQSYVLGKPGLFPCSDTAFILAYFCMETDIDIRVCFKCSTFNCSFICRINLIIRVFFLYYESRVGRVGRYLSTFEPKGIGSNTVQLSFIYEKKKTVRIKTVMAL